MLLLGHAVQTEASLFGLSVQKGYKRGMSEGRVRKTHLLVFEG